MNRVTVSVLSPVWLDSAHFDDDGILKDCHVDVNQTQSGVVFWPKPVSLHRMSLAFMDQRIKYKDSLVVAATVRKAWAVQMSAYIGFDLHIAETPSGRRLRMAIESGECPPMSFTFDVNVANIPRDPEEFKTVAEFVRLGDLSIG